MNIYVSCPHSFSDGLDRVVKYLCLHSSFTSGSVTCNKKGEAYDFSLLEQADCVVFVLDNFKWQEKLENISRGMLSELVHCLNHKKSFYLAYRSTDGLNIYGAQITPDLVFSGIAGTKGNIFKIHDSASADFSANLHAIVKEAAEMNKIGINYELEETPKSTNSYFY